MIKREKVYEKLNEIFQNIFDNDSIIVHDMIALEEIEDWDSLEHINFLMIVESKFHIKFDPEDVLIINNVGDLVDTILKKIE